MKAPHLFALTLLCASALPLPAVEPATELLTEAQTAYLRGDVEAAKAKFESVLKLDPKNAAAIGYLRNIRAKEMMKGANGNQERQLSTLIVPSIQFREATLSAVLEALRQQVPKLTAGKQAINFVVQLPPEQAQTGISLSLTNVPFTEVLKYVGTLANVSFVYDKYAITVKPLAGVGGEAPAKTDAAAK